MKDFDSGVHYFTHAYAVVEVNFPENDVCCMQCPYFSRTSGWCQLNKKLVAYPKNHTGQECPLILKEKEE